MCIICVKPKGVVMPSDKEIYTMFANNPHGAGFMYVRDGKVIISKGYMDVVEFMQGLEVSEVGKDDVVIFHFRISTQGGINPEMTQPFPLTHDDEHLRALDVAAGVGICHNGIIRATSRFYEKSMSDTAIFIKRVLSHEIKRASDITKELLDDIEYMIESKMVILERSEKFHVIGKFSEHDGRLYSNESWKSYKEPVKSKSYSRFPYIWK